jgi:sugar lactone lactonase YvrE
VAIWNGGKVLKIDAEKSLVVDQIDVEVNKPSSCAFVGENLDKLLITSANFLEQDKNAGSLYIANVNAKGFKVNLYKKGE